MSIPTLYQNGKVSQVMMRNIFTFSGIYLLDKNGDHPGMENKQIRRLNARWLSKRAGGDARFAEKMDREPPRVSHLIGKTPTRGIGDKTMRAITIAFDLPGGWMDAPHPDLWRELDFSQWDEGPALLDELGYDTSEEKETAQSHTPPVPSGRYIPVVGVVLGGPDGYISIDDYPPGQGGAFILTLSQDPNAYALEVRGDSMRPRMKSKDFIIVEPNREAQPGNDVVVKLKNDKGMVKEWMYRNESEVRLGSTNDDFKAINVPLDEIESIHRVGDIVPAGSDRIVTEMSKPELVQNTESQPQEHRTSSDRPQDAADKYSLPLLNGPASSNSEHEQGA